MYMDGVDKSDQMKSYYGLNQKSKHWTPRLVWYFIDLAAVNVYCLYKANLQANLHPQLPPIRTMDSLDLHCSLIDHLLMSSLSENTRSSTTSNQSNNSTGITLDISLLKRRCAYCCLGKKPGHTKRKRKN